MRWCTVGGVRVGRCGVCGGVVLMWDGEGEVVYSGRGEGGEV